MNKAKCKECEHKVENKCLLENADLAEMERCPIHDPDQVEELNDPNYQTHIEELEK